MHKDLEEALSLQPQDAYIINYLAYSWLDRKKYKQSIRIIRKGCAN